MNKKLLAIGAGVFLFSTGVLQVAAQTMWMTFAKSSGMSGGEYNYYQIDINSIAEYNGRKYFKLRTKRFDRNSNVLFVTRGDNTGSMDCQNGIYWDSGGKPTYRTSRSWWGEFEPGEDRAFIDMMKASFGTTKPPYNEGIYQTICEE